MRHPTRAVSDHRSDHLLEVPVSRTTELLSTLAAGAVGAAVAVVVVGASPLLVLPAVAGVAAVAVVAPRRAGG